MSADWVRLEEIAGWLHLTINVKICPTCWAPLVIMSDPPGRYDWDGRKNHQCGPTDGQTNA